MKPIFSIFILFSFTATIQAQKACNKTLSFEDVTERYEAWENYGTLVTQMNDSVTVAYNGKPITRFILEKHTIPGPTHIEYYLNGNIRQIDSLSDERGWKWNMYWGMYEQATVYTKRFYPSGIPKEFTYYFKKDGNDSLSKKWYPNGVLQESILYDEYENKISHYKWSDEGIITYLKTSRTEKEFYPSGAIKSSTVDTTVDRDWHRTVKTYYPAGTLKTVKQYKNGRDYGTWLYYTENGTLESKAEQTFIIDFISLPETPMRPPSPTCRGYRTYYFMDPLFPEGNGGLYKYLNMHLNDAICQNKRRLKGMYEIHLTIDFDGTAIFEDFIGQNSAYIKEAVKQTIEQMPKWKPGKRNEKTTKVGLSLKFSIKKTDIRP